MEFTFFSLQFPREYSMGCISSDFVLNLELILYNQALCSVLPLTPPSTLTNVEFEKEQKQPTNITQLYFASKLISLNKVS